MGSIIKNRKPVKHLPFEFLFEGKTSSLNKTLSQKLSPQLSLTIHEIVWRADNNSGEAVISANQLSDEFGISIRAARKLLNDLKKAGLITSKRGSPANRYTINREKAEEFLGSGKDEDTTKSMPNFYYTDRRLTVPKWLIQEIGLTEAVVFAELVWTYRRLIIGNKILPEDPFYRSYYSIGEEIGLSEDQVYRAVKKLKNAKLLFTERKGYARKCHFSLAEDRAIELQKSRQELHKNAGHINTFRGTITILKNNNIKFKSSDFEKIGDKKPEIDQTHSLSRDYVKRDPPEGGALYIASIPGITLEGRRKYSEYEASVLKLVGENYLKATGETFRFGGGVYDREDLSKLCEFSLAEIEAIVYNCIEAWKKGLPGFVKYPPHIRTIVAKLDLLRSCNIADLEARRNRNRMMKKLREAKQKKNRKKYIPGQYYPELMDKNSLWG